MIRKLPPHVLLVLATLLWGGNFVIGRAVAGQLPPYTLSFARWCVALLVFLPFCWQQIRTDWPVLRQHLPMLFFLSLTGVAGFNTLLYIALHYTTSINASLVNTSTPIIIYLITFFVLREKLTRNQLIGIAISLIGVICIISKGSIAALLAFSFNKGDLLVIAAVICWSIYSILIKKTAGQLPGNTTFAATIVIGIILLFPFFLYETFWSGAQAVWSVSSFATILYVGIMASIAAFLSWNTAVARVGAAHAGVFLNLIPVFASLFAVLFLHEYIAWYQLLGGAFVVTGVYISAKVPRSVVQYKHTTTN